MSRGKGFQSLRNLTSIQLSHGVGRSPTTAMRNSYLLSLSLFHLFLFYFFLSNSGNDMHKFQTHKSYTMKKVKNKYPECSTERKHINVEKHILDKRYVLTVMITASTDKVCECLSRSEAQVTDQFSKAEFPSQL